MLERIEPRVASMKTIEIAPVSNKPHRDEDDGLIHKLKIAGLFKISLTLAMTLPESLAAAEFAFVSINRKILLHSAD